MSFVIKLEFKIFRIVKKLFPHLFSSYRLRVESMLLKAEFEADMSFLEPAIEAMICAGHGELLWCL